MKTVVASSLGVLTLGLLVHCAVSAAPAAKSEWTVKYSITITRLQRADGDEAFEISSYQPDHSQPPLNPDVMMEAGQYLRDFCDPDSELTKRRNEQLRELLRSQRGPK